MFVIVVAVVVPMPVLVFEQLMRMAMRMLLQRKKHNCRNEQRAGKKARGRNGFGEQQYRQEHAEKRCAGKCDLGARCTQRLRRRNIKHDARAVREYADEQR